MMYAVHPRSSWILASAVVLVGLSGCSNIESTMVAPTPCPKGNEIGSACAGVPQDAICDGDYCTEGVKCSSVVKASDDASLADAINGAKAGTCIALAPGTYDDVKLPAGVSLLGAGAEQVTVASVSLDGATLRGVAVVGGGVVVAGLDARIESTRIKGSSGSGVDIAAGATVTIVSSEIRESAQYGVRAFDVSSVALEATIVQGSAGPGVWAQCAKGCDCVAKPVVSLLTTILRDNKIVGVSLVGVSGTLTTVDVTDNSEGKNFTASGGISASGCSEVVASGLRVMDNSSFGVLVDASSGTFGGTGEGEGVEVSRNFMGVWVQNVADGQPVKLDGLTIADNSVVGLGTAGESRGIICWNSAITGTKKAVVPVLAGAMPASQEVGDGIAWLAGSQMQLDKVTLSGNGRASILIDGNTASGSTMSNITLSGGDEALGILQQNVSGQTVSPEADANTPAITTSATEKLSVPVGPAVPVGM